MKSLQTIQKTFRVFQILTKIAMILTFVWAGLSLLGMLCGAVWYCSGTVTGAGRDILYFLTETRGLAEMEGILLSDTIFALADGIVLVFAFRYFKMEQADGTPFTKQGAEEIKRLGIRVIVLPLVSVILSAIVCAVFQLPQNANGNWNSPAGIAIGIVFIIASLIFRYGAELEERTEIS